MKRWLIIPIRHLSMTVRSLRGAKTLLSAALSIPIQKRIGIILLGALALGSCSDESPVDFPPLSFTRYQPIYLNVSRVEFVNEYKSPLRPPNVEHLMPSSPEDAMRIWVNDRIRAVGPANSLCGIEL